MDLPSEINAARWHRARDTFDGIWRRSVCERRETDIVVCGERARLRVAGGFLAQRLLAPFQHLAVGGGEAGARLHVDLWDERAAGAAGLAEAECHPEGRTWLLGDGSFAASPDGRFASHRLRRSIVWLDRRDERMVGWFADGADLSLHEQAKPLQMLLALWAHDRGVQAVHAAMVARGGDGVLVPARSGAGKSTVALACLNAGYTYLGDDWIGVAAGADGCLVGHGLYGSLFLEAGHAARFPALRPHLLPPTDVREHKSLALLPPLFPGGLGVSARVRALALPRIADRGEASWWPASKQDALLLLAPSAVFAMRPRGGREQVERLAEIAASVPAFWLEIGRDLDSIPSCMGEILEAGIAAAAPH